MRGTLLLVGLLVLCTSGCFSFTWSARQSHHEPPAAALAKLDVGRSELGACLDALGAPLVVDEVGEEVALYYGWTRGRGWGFTADVPLGKDSASFSYADDDDHLRGLRLLFDANLVLTDLRRGRLSDLRQGVRARPQVLEEEP
jgi:hypothetical protein